MLATRSMPTVAAKKRTTKYIIRLKPVSLNGDEFKSDTEYFKQIPGHWESIVEASNEPINNLSTARQCGWNI